MTSIRANCHTIQRATLCAVAMFTSAALLTACGGSSTDNATATRAISIPFEAFAGSTEINCAATLQSLGLSGVDASMSDFKLFVHNVRLVTDEGVELAVQLDDINGWQTDGIALLDFQDYGDSCNTASELNAKPVNKVLYGRVADRPVVIAALRFTIGVPASHNHANYAVATAPLNTQSMFWSWQGGYKHMRLDVKPANGVSRPGQFDNQNPPQPLADATLWQFHLGDTNCSLDPVGTCQYQNRPEIHLVDFVDGESVIRIDYAALMLNSELSEDQGGAPGCMSGTSDPECANSFDTLGLDLGPADNVPPSAQSVFSVTN